MRKDCTSCEHFGKGECDYIKCHKNKMSEYKIIKKHKRLSLEQIKFLVDKYNL